MRMYQEIGLKQEARDFLDRHTKKVPTTVCPKCGEVIAWKSDGKIYFFEELFCNDGPSLWEYNLKDGRKIKEVVQAEPWSSGPVAFFCLEYEDGTRIFEWEEEEMEEYL